MWSNSATLMIVRVKVKRRREFTFPVTVWVIDEFMDALRDLAWVGEVILKCIPLPQDEKAAKPLRWIKGISPSGIVEASHGLIKELTKYKGMDIVYVETGIVRVKISLK
ncbi:hypothetical protein [Desulfosporosinus sp. SB140]|uniref:hypothetical protein n=1 Tax=Desulfosporosinus paludis TaxID=3115649 RepID=UPI003890904A